MADNLTTFMYRLSWNMGASTSWKPQGLSRPVMGLLYLLLYIYNSVSGMLMEWASEGTWFDSWKKHSIYFHSPAPGVATKSETRRPAQPLSQSVPAFFPVHKCARYEEYHPHPCGPGSSVRIAIDYKLDGPGTESRWGRDFPHLSKPALGSTQPPVQWVPGLSRGEKSGRGLTLTSHPLLVPLVMKE